MKFSIVLYPNQAKKSHRAQLAPRSINAPQIIPIRKPTYIRTTPNGCSAENSESCFCTSGVLGRKLPTKAPAPRTMKIQLTMVTESGRLRMGARLRGLQPEGKMNQPTQSASFDMPRRSQGSTAPSRHDSVSGGTSHFLTTAAIYLSLSTPCGARERHPTISKEFARK